MTQWKGLAEQLASDATAAVTVQKKYQTDVKVQSVAQLSNRCTIVLIRLALTCVCCVQVLSQQLSDCNHMIGDLQGANTALSKKLTATEEALSRSTAALAREKVRVAELTKELQLRY